MFNCSILQEHFVEKTNNLPKEVVVASSHNSRVSTIPATLKFVKYAVILVQ